MPNFHTIDFIAPKLPFREGAYTFLWEASFEDSKLILVEHDSEKFFISRYKKDGTYLIKGEKISRPTQAIFLQTALGIYAKASKSNPILSNIKPASNRFTKRSSILKNIDFFANYSFSKEDKILIEIGFGSGRHLIHLATKYPEKQIIGVEIHKPSIEQVIKQCEAMDIKNVTLIDYDARILMEFLPSNSVERIFVHFPVPWDKKPHRRVISKFFVNEAMRVLKKEGTLELRTDSEQYFEDSLEIFKSIKDANVEVLKNSDLKIRSKYEDRWKRMDKNIYDIILKNGNISQEIQSPQVLEFGKIFDLDRIINEFSPKTEVGEDFFVHFEALYESAENLVIKLAFGDKQRGEHSFLILNREGVCYFPFRVFATMANKKSHKIIEKWLNG